MHFCHTILPYWVMALQAVFVAPHGTLIEHHVVPLHPQRPQRKRHCTPALQQEPDHSKPVESRRQGPRSSRGYRPFPGERLPWTPGVASPPGVRRLFMTEVARPHPYFPTESVSPPKICGQWPHSSCRGTPKTPCPSNSSQIIFLHEFRAVPLCAR